MPPARDRTYAAARSGDPQPAQRRGLGHAGKVGKRRRSLLMSLPRTVLDPPRVVQDVPPPVDTIRGGVPGPVSPGPPRNRARRGAAPGLAVLLLGTAVLYLWGLGASDTPTSSTPPRSKPARRAGRRCSSARSTPATPSPLTSPPSSSGRWRSRRGCSASTGWSVLVPQALERRLRPSACARGRRPGGVAGHAAGLLAGARARRVTPVAVLIFRFDNPDAMLTLLLTAAGYATVRAVTAPGTRGWGGSARGGWPSPAASRAHHREDGGRPSWSCPDSPWRICGRLL